MPINIIIIFTNYVYESSINASFKLGEISSIYFLNALISSYFFFIISSFFLRCLSAYGVAINNLFLESFSTLYVSIFFFKS